VGVMTKASVFLASLYGIMKLLWNNNFQDKTGMNGKISILKGEVFFFLLPVFFSKPLCKQTSSKKTLTQSINRHPLIKKFTEA